jgi:DNA-binding XRE family transcriptional regulator
MKEGWSAERRKRIRKNKGIDNILLDDDYRNLILIVSGNIEKARHENCLTQEQMIALGFERRFYQRLESGKYAMSLITLYRISIALRKPIQSFFVECKTKDFKIIHEIPVEASMSVLNQLNPRNFLK